LGDARLRSRLGQAARRTVEERYSFALRMKKIGAIYDKLLCQAPKTEPQMNADERR
jgi:hypothetical protein